MDANLKTKWVEALRGGKYKQTTGQLRDDDGFCCLGVLCDIQGADFDAIRERFGSLSLSNNPTQYLGELPAGFSNRLASMNDMGSSFSVIAKYIEANL